MKIKFFLDDGLPLARTLELHNPIIVIRSFFDEGKKYYPQVFFDECLYK